MIGRTGLDERTPRIRELAPNLTPLLDVLFMLLIFLILTANTAQFALEITLPQAAEPKQTVLAEPQVVITLYGAGEAITIDNVTTRDWARAREVLSARVNAEPDAWYLIAGDKNVTLQKVVRVLSFLEARGISQVRILVEQE